MNGAIERSKPAAEPDCVARQQDSAKPNDPPRVPLCDPRHHVLRYALFRTIRCRAHGDRLRYLLRGHRQFRRHRRVLAPRAPTGERARLAGACVRRRPAGVPEAVPVAGADRARQAVGGIVIEHWHEPAHAGDTLEVADVVIEAFGCELPPIYVAAMARRERAPVWLNLEYLSAEDWVADFHLRPSPHPRYPLTKTFFFPGLGPGTGGVLKERASRRRARGLRGVATGARSVVAEAHRRTPPPATATVISLFAYENPAVDSLLEQWRDSADADRAAGAGRPHFRCSRALFRSAARFARGFACRRAAASAPTRSLSPNNPLRRAALGQPTSISYAARIRSCAPNGPPNPFVWHIYPQADDAHLPKLDAALAHYARTPCPPTRGTPSRASGMHGTARAGRTGRNSGATARRLNNARPNGPANWPRSATSLEIWPCSQKLS